MSASYSNTHLVNVNLDISLWWEKTNRTRPSEGMEGPRVTKFRHKLLVGKNQLYSAWRGHGRYGGHPNAFSKCEFRHKLQKGKNNHTRPSELQQYVIVKCELRHKPQVEKTIVLGLARAWKFLELPYLAHVDITTL